MFRFLLFCFTFTFVSNIYLSLSTENTELFKNQEINSMFALKWNSISLHTFLTLKSRCSPISFHFQPCINLHGSQSITQWSQHCNNWILNMHYYSRKLSFILGICNQPCNCYWQVQAISLICHIPRDIRVDIGAHHISSHG